MKPAVYLGFTAAPDLLGHVIRVFEDALVSHAFLAWDSPEFDCRMSLGANENGVTMQPLSRFVHDDPTLYQGPRDLWPGIIKNIDLINTPYGYATLLGMTIVEAEKRMFGRAGSNPIKQAAVICSEYCAKVLRDSGYLVMPGIEAGSIDPGALEGWALTNGFAEVH